MADSKGHGTSCITCIILKLANVFAICNIIKISCLRQMAVFLFTNSFCYCDENFTFLFCIELSVKQRIRPSWPGGEKCSRLWREASEGGRLWIVAWRVRWESVPFQKEQKTANQMDVAGSHSWSRVHGREWRVSIEWSRRRSRWG